MYSEKMMNHEDSMEPRPHPSLPVDHPWNSENSAFPECNEGYEAHFDAEGRKLNLAQMDAEHIKNGTGDEDGDGALPSSGGRITEEHDDLMKQHAEWAANNGADPSNPGWSITGISLGQQLHDSQD